MWAPWLVGEFGHGNIVAVTYAEHTCIDTNGWNKGIFVPKPKAHLEKRDLITVEIENVCIEALETIEAQGKKVFPQPSVLRIIRDKGTQKLFFDKHHIPTAPYVLVENKAELTAHVGNFPFMQKLRVGGYDGKGVHALVNEASIDNAFDAPCVLEQLIDFQKEISVIVARNESGEVVTFPLVECEFNPQANLVEFLFAPASISNAVEQKAQEIALTIIDQLGMIGILAVEFFLLPDESLLVNDP